jgi:flagellar hook-length control protein FliK
VNATIGREKPDIITGSANKAPLEPKALDITKLVTTDTKPAQNPILNNDSDKLALTLNQAGMAANNQTNAANVINQVQSSSPNDNGILLSSAPKPQEVNKPQTDIERAISRENINPTFKSENKIPGLKLSPLEADISIRVVDNNTAPRVSNAAGNNILQAQNGAQAGDNNAALSSRGVSTQSLNLPQHQVETGQSNQQTSNVKPLHVGANTGENSSSFTQNSSQGNSSNVASNTANQPGVTPINGLETFKQHALKSDGSTNQHPVTRKIGSASLGTQTNQPTAPNALAGVNASSPQTTNSVLAAQQPVTNSRPGAAPAATNQVSVQLSKAIQNGDNKIKIQLRPQELGRVEVKLEIATDGRAKAMIIAERSETLDILQKDVRVLERALQDAGLKTDQNSLSFDLHGRKDNSDTRQANSESSKDDTNPDTSDVSNSLENESNPISATAIGITPDGSINLLT